MRIKKALTILLALVFACIVPLASAGAEPDASPAPTLISYKSTGERVVRIQLRLRELGYFHFKPTGSFQNMTVQSTIKFQQRQQGSGGEPIIADGTVGEQSMALLFSPSATRADILADIPVGPQSSSGATERVGELISWPSVKSLLTVGTTYRITDYITGQSFNIIFVGGERHAEVECASAADTAVFLAVFGGDISYFKRPMLFEVGDKVIASSMQGWPHGKDNVSGNDMQGSVCLYFEGSVSHVGSLADVEHLNHVYKAAGRS